MSFEEKAAWVSGFVSVLVAGVYFSFVLGQAAHTPVAQIAYQRPLLISVGAMIVLTIVGSIVMAIGSAVGAELSGRGAANGIDRKDERDVRIQQRGDLIGYYTSSVGMLGALALTMLGYPHFWIANAIYAAFVVASLVSTTVKIVAWRRGF